MTPLRRLLFAGFAALSLLLSVTTSRAQVPPPVPALPDTERRTSYSISASTCICSVGFQIYGDSNDFSNWVEVWLNGALVQFNDPSFGWTITSPTGPLSIIPRPVTDGILTFNNAQTGTVQIVGARRPRRASQFQEGRGIAARDFNQALTDIVAQNRETWDKINDVTGRAPLALPGESIGPLPAKANRLNTGACFDANGNLTSCVSIPSSTFSAGIGISLVGSNPTSINLKPAQPSALGGVESLACPAGQAVGTISTLGVPICVPATSISGTSAVAGVSTTFTSAQNSLLVERSNSGSAMSDTLPGTSPGILPSTTVITVTNTDTAGILAIGAGSGASIKTGKGLTGFVYVCPGQTVSFYSDGANYYATKNPELCVFGADTVIFLATSGTGGSDTNNGLTSSTPMLTLQNAWNLARQSFNVNGHKLTFQLADGTYSTSAITSLTGQITGQVCRRGVHDGTGNSLVWVQGDVATPTNVIYGSTGGFTLVVDDGACVVFKSFRVTNSGSFGYQIWVQNAFLDFYALDFGAGGSVPHMVATAGGSIMAHAPYSISAGGGCQILAGEGGSYQEYSVNLTVATVTLSGSPAWISGFACAQHNGSIVISIANTYSGASTGPRYSAFLNGVINTGGQGASYFPGSTVGTTSTGGQYN